MLSPARREVLAKTAAKHYKRRCWWADFDDLVQTAYEAILKAETTFRPEVGVAEDAYAWKAILNLLHKRIWKDSSPVSGGSHRPAVSYAGLHRTAFPPEDMERDLPPARSNPEKLVGRAEWEAKVRARLAALSLPEVAAALLDEDRVEESAKKLCVSPREIRTAVQIVRARAVRDPELYDLFRARARG